MVILSLGAGVQSSTLALMAKHGETQMPDHAIFADTGDEPKAVYEWLGYLESILPFPVHRVSKGNLGEDFLAAIRGESNCCGQPPFFVRNSNNDGTEKEDRGGMLWRKCTSEYKLSPIRKKVRELSGGQPVVQLIGISWDEAHRMKESGVKYITNSYPLVDKRITRQDCLKWMDKNNYPRPPKSACVFCPYTSDERWREMKNNHPEDWQAAVTFDDSLRSQRVARTAAGITGEIYVHRSMKPLSEVDLRNAEDIGQVDMFGNECEGMCGV